MFFFRSYTKLCRFAAGVIGSAVAAGILLSFLG
jgi:Na+-transporting methylmalonyl-CoA/oxaloacetate decarboxylase beta subunit